MAIDTLKRTILFVLLCLVQALVFNHIHLFNVAPPLLYVYLAIIFPRNYPKWAILLWCFCLGLAIDLFSNTPGVASASLTLVGAIQPYLLEPFVPRDSIETLPASAKALGAGKFLVFTLILTSVYCLAFFTLETFSFFNWQHWLLSIGGSTLLTVVLIVTLESLRKE